MSVLPSLRAVRALADPPLWLLVAVVSLALALVLARARGTRRRQVGLAVVSTLLALVAGELGCRWLGLGTPIEQAVWRYEPAKGPGFEHLLEPGSELEFRYSSNPRGYFDSDNRIVARVNSRGFRGPETTPEKPPGAFRIVVLGDSFTVGVGVRDEHTLPAQLERELREGSPLARSGIEVLNLGVSATNTVQQVRLLEAQALAYHPDLTLIVMFLNDTGALGTIDFLARPFVLSRLREYSHLANAVVGGVEGRALHRAMVAHYHRSFAPESTGWIEARRALRRARAACEASGSSLVVVLYPVLYGLDGEYPFGGVHEAVRAFAAEEAIAFVDLLPAYAGRRARELWVHPTDQHPNEVAQGLAAAYLARELAGRGLVPAPGPTLPPG